MDVAQPPLRGHGFLEKDMLTTLTEENNANFRGEYQMEKKPHENIIDMSSQQQVAFKDAMCTAVKKALITGENLNRAMNVVHNQAFLQEAIDSKSVKKKDGNALADSNAKLSGTDEPEQKALISEREFRYEVEDRKRNLNNRNNFGFLQR